MSTRPDHRNGFKLIELMVVVLSSGAVIGVVLRALMAARAAGRVTQCANNMRQLGLALINFSSSKHRFPNAGTFLDDPAIHQGDPTKSTIFQAITNPASFQGKPNPWLRNWFVDVLPYIDAQDHASEWDKGGSYLSVTPLNTSLLSNRRLSSTSMGVLRCPDDPTTSAVGGNLSYVVNGGFSRWHALSIGWNGSKVDGQSKNGGMLQWTPPGNPWEATQAVNHKLGVMFLGTDTGDQPWDIATGPNDIPDGSSNTLLIAENTLVGDSPGTPYSGGFATNWACPLPNFCMFIASDDVCRTGRSTTDCLAGTLKSPSKDKDGPGWSWANRAGTHENLGYGQNLTVEGSFPFANSGHPGGGNFVFCDGSTRFLSNSIDGTVYAKLISPAGGKLPAPLLQGPLAADIWDPAL